MGADDVSAILLIGELILRADAVLVEGSADVQVVHRVKRIAEEFAGDVDAAGMPAASMLSRALRHVVEKREAGEPAAEAWAAVAGALLPMAARERDAVRAGGRAR